MKRNAIRRLALLLCQGSILALGILPAHGEDTNAPSAHQSVPGSAVVSGIAVVIVGLISLAIVVGGFIFATALFKLWKERLNRPQSAGDSDTQFRGLLARTVTVGALIFIGIVAGIVLLSAGLYSLVPRAGTDTSQMFFDVAKYLLATLLPVISAWVGTVLAFYFGKENFEAATKSVKDMASVLTSKDKLATTPVKVLGKAKQDFIGHSLGTSDPNVAKTEPLNRIEDAFTKNGVTYERLPVLFANDLPYLLLHQSTLNDFLLGKARENPPKQANQCTLTDLFAVGTSGQPWPPEISFVTGGPDGTAAQAKAEMEKKKGCCDIYVTTDGTPKSAVLRWLTNVDLLKASEI